MREVPQSMTTAWRSGMFVGENRPIARCVIRQPYMKMHSSAHPAPAQIPTVSQSGIGLAFRARPKRSVHQQYADYVTTAQKRPRELPNVKSVSWTRGVSQDVGQATIELWNTDILPVGATPVGDPLRAGYYTYSYGGTTLSSRWGHMKNEWHGWLMPDMIIETYEGFGYTKDTPPEKDPKLVQTGVWRIIDVDMTATDRVIRLTCEDLGSLLRDHIAYPPVVPDDWYPLKFGPIPEPIRKDSIAAGSPIQCTVDFTSNRPWNNDGPMYGHRKEAVLMDDEGFWLSVGNAHPSRGFAYEYVQLRLSQSSTVGEVKFRTARAGYTAYLSVSKDGGRTWLGDNTIGWRSDGIGRNGGNIRYIAEQPVTSEGFHGWRIREDGVTHVRVTLGNLQNFGVGNLKYRGAFKRIMVLSPERTVTEYIETVPKTAQAGSYAGIANDWSDVIKMCLAWGGFYVPIGARKLLSDGSLLSMGPKNPDPVLAADGRVWGDIEISGTMGPAGYRNLSKQPLRQVIQGVLDILGFIFFIDETGAAIVRSANLYEAGNWIGTMSDQPRRVKQIITLDESSSIIELKTRLSSRNMRDRISVGNPMNVTQGDKTGGVSATVAGWNPNPTGLRRHALWLDQGFVTKNEALVMADMIAVRGAFTYRTSEITIPAYPAIQVDDQVRVYERTTSEGYLHYVDSITSQNDQVSGVWTYQLTTHWLGEHPDGTWAFNQNQFTPPTKLHRSFDRGIKGQAAGPVGEMQFGIRAVGFKGKAGAE